MFAVTDTIMFSVMDAAFRCRCLLSSTQPFVIDVFSDVSGFIADVCCHRNIFFGDVRIFIVGVNTAFQ